MAREKREDANLSLEEIYEKTRVRLEYLQGIEDGNYRGFPDLVYIKGFVRTYLSVVGAEDLKDEFIAWLNKDEVPKERRLPPTNILGNGTSPTKGFKPASHLWLFAILLLALAGSGYYVWYSWSSNPFIIDLRQFQREVPPSESVETVPSDDIQSQDTPPVAVLSVDNSAGPVLSILPASQNIEPEPEPAPLKPSLLIRARGDVWTRVTIGEKVVFTKTMKSGEEVSWDLSSEARVTYGRPNMAEVTLNGKALGPANPRGSRTSETYTYNPDGTYKKVQPQSQ
jgi:cytoskeletal protein RodZ